jgi:signal transduction histidine kinase
MVRSRTGDGRRGSAWRRLPLGAKILIPIFVITLVTTFSSAAFFGFQQVDVERAAKAAEGKAVAVVVQGALEASRESQDPSTLGDFLRHIDLAYPDVAAICVLQANPADPLGPLVVFTSTNAATICDPASPLTPGLGVNGVKSRTLTTAAGPMVETAIGAGLGNTGKSVVVQVMVRRTSVMDVVVPTFIKAALAGLLLDVLLSGIVFAILWFSALRPLQRLRIAASGAAQAAQPSSRDSAQPQSAGGDEIDDLALRFDEMLVAVRDREHDLVESHAELENLISNAPVMVFSTDRDGRMIQLRGTGIEVVPKLLGHERIEDVMVLELAGPNMELQRLLRRALTGEKIHEVVALNRFLEQDQTEPMYMDVILNPIFDTERRFAGITGIAVNVSDRVDAASARAESEQKSAFLAAMSHELRTPLNSIMGFSQLLDLPGAKPALTTKQKRYVGHILSSGSHLLALVGDILDLAKVGAGQLEVNLERVPVHDLVLDPVDRVGVLALEKNLAIDVYLPPELVAYTDPLRVRQMMNNLLTNAVKFTPKDGGRILVSGRALNGGVELAVIDSGIGIAPEDQEKIFDEFTQVDRGPTRSLDGTGLGLTLTRRLAALVGGSVRVESAPGVGSTFTIWLPGMASGAEVARPPAVAAVSL